MNPVVLQQPRRVLFGVGTAARILEELVAADRKKIFVVSSPTAARHNEALFAGWRTAGLAVEVNATVSREPEIALFESVVAAARAFGFRRWSQLLSQ